MKNILVLGGTGFVGTCVCTQLAAQGWHVTVLTRKRANAAHLLGLPGLSVLEVDVQDASALAHAVSGHDTVVNLVAILHGSQAAFEQVHVALARSIAQACVANHVQHLVHISALGADGRNPDTPPSMYLRSKSQGEAVLMQAAAASAETDAPLALSILRPSVIFGVQDKFLNVFAKLQTVLPVVPLAGANVHFQPVWVQDVANAVVRVIERTGPVVEPLVLELCGAEVFTLRELVQLAGRCSGARGGKGRPVIALPIWLARLQARLMELAPGEPVMSRDNLDSMKIDNVASGSVPGLQLLGIEPAALGPIARDYLAKNRTISAK